MCVLAQDFAVLRDGSHSLLNLDSKIDMEGKVQYTRLPYIMWMTLALPVGRFSVL